MKKTIKERRIEVLKDALLQVKNKLYKVERRTYVLLSPTLQSIQNDITFERSKDLSAQECLLKDKKPCTVCAKGAVFLSLVRKENKVKMSVLDDNDVREEKSNKLFGQKNMDRMEAAFEKYIYMDSDGGLSSYSNGGERKKDVVMYNFVKKYPNTKDRLIAILKNAIRHDGIFKP